MCDYTANQPLTAGSAALRFARHASPTGAVVALAPQAAVATPNPNPVPGPNPNPAPDPVPSSPSRLRWTCETLRAVGAWTLVTIARCGCDLLLLCFTTALLTMARGST